MERIFENIRKYNFWDNQSPDFGYFRDIYLKRINKFIDNKLIKVIIGQRRSGKSYLLRQIINSLINERGVNPGNIFYFNKEYTAFDDISDSRKLEELFNFYKKKLNVVGKIYIFLDEVQNIENWERFVNSYSQDFSNDYELFISGSNSKLLSGELANLLSGRYIEFKVFPFSLCEYAGLNDKPVNKDLFLDFFQKGGLPELTKLQDDEMKRHYVESLKNTIVFRDIIDRYKIKDAPLLEEIFNFLLLNIGFLTSIPSIIKYFKSKQRKTNYETLSTYINYLTETFVLDEVVRYNIRGKQTLGGAKKYFLNDLAFKNYLYGFYPDDITSNLENFVHGELKKSGYNLFVGNVNSNEIDFIAEKNERKIYFQVSYMLNNEETLKREFGNLLKIKDNHEKYVVSLDELKFTNYEGIIHIWPWELPNII